MIKSQNTTKILLHSPLFKITAYNEMYLFFVTVYVSNDLIVGLANI